MTETGLRRSGKGESDCSDRDPDVEASEWFARLRADDVSEAERQAFEAWRRDPVNAAAWREVNDLWQRLEQPARELATKEPAGEDPPRRPHRYPVGALAAALLIAIGLGFWLPGQWIIWQSDYHTAPGQRQEITLTDGSRLWLNTDSAVRVSYERESRAVDLLRGEILVDVESNPERPFTVHAGPGRVRVTGTRFGVRADGDRFAVSVLEGEVEVTVDETRRLRPRQRLRYTAGGVTGEAEPFRPAAAYAWRDGRLRLDGVPLTEAADELDRYRNGRTFVLGDELRRREVSGMFHIEDADAAVASLARGLGLELTRLPGGYLLIHP